MVQEAKLISQDGRKLWVLNDTSGVDEAEHGYFLFLCM